MTPSPIPSGRPGPSVHPFGLGLVQRRAGTLDHSPELAILLFHQQGLSPLRRERVPARAAGEMGV